MDGRVSMCYVNYSVTFLCRHSAKFTSTWL